MVLLAAAVSAAAADRVVSGVVLDPQRLPVRGAHAALTCGSLTLDTTTDDRGDFTFAVHGRDPCVLRVVHPGFLAEERPVDGAIGVVELRVAPVHDAVDVVLPREIASFDMWQRGVVTAPDLAAFSDRVDEWTSIARAMAGAPDAGGALYVDGMPSRTQPLKGTVQLVAVDTDPFAAEYGDPHRLEFVTGAPPRKWHVNFGGDLLPAGARNLIGAGGRSDSHAANADLSGGIPRTKWSIALELRDERHDLSQPLTGLVGGTTDVGRHAWAESARMFAPLSERTEFRASFSTTGDALTNGGAGELVLPDAGNSSTTVMRDAAISFHHKWNSLEFRTAVTANGTDVSTRANSDAVGIRVLGALTDGGAQASAQTAVDREWTWKSVLASRTRPAWKMGVVIGHASALRRETPNPNGYVEFSTPAQYELWLLGVPAGVWFRQNGVLDVTAATSTAAAFGEYAVVDRERLLLRAGVRADWQRGDAVRPSPRLSATVRAGEWALYSGGGLFPQAWTLDEFIPSLASAQGLWRQTMTILPGSTSSDVYSTVASQFVRREDVIARASFKRVQGRVMPGIEYTVDAGQHLAGSRRLSAAAGYVDVLESNRRSTSHELHGSMRLSLGRQRLIVNYEWLVSHDDTAGPFSFPELQDDVSREWAPSAGIARHNAQVVDSVTLPGAWSLSVVGLVRSSSLYDVTSGLDPAGNGLFTDRAGLPRNSGVIPRSGSLDVFASRRVTLPRQVFRTMSATVGVRAANVLSSRTYTDFGSVLSSPLAGHPLGALPGASLRVWMSLG